VALPDAVASDGAGALARMQTGLQAGLTHLVIVHVKTAMF